MPPLRKPRGSASPPWPPPPPVAVAVAAARAPHVDADGGGDDQRDAASAAPRPPRPPPHIVENLYVEARQAAYQSKWHPAQVHSVHPDKGHAVVTWLTEDRQSGPLDFGLIRPLNGRRSRRPSAGVPAGRQSTTVSRSKSKDPSTKGPKKKEKKEPAKKKKKKSVPRSGGNDGGQRSSASTRTAGLQRLHNEEDDRDSAPPAAAAATALALSANGVTVPAHIAKNKPVQARESETQTEKHVATVVQVDAAKGAATVKWNNGAVSNPLPFSLIEPMRSGPRATRGATAVPVERKDEVVKKKTAAKKRKQAAPKKKQPVFDESSDEESESEEEDYKPQPTKRRGRPARAAATKAAKSTVAAAEKNPFDWGEFNDNSENESSSSEVESVFDDNFDNDRLIEDEEDRKMLDKMSELGRESILADRFEKLKKKAEMKKAQTEIR